MCSINSSHTFSERCVPLDRMQAVTIATVGRLRDKAAQVRKNAIQLLTTMLQYNPYSPKLSLSEFSAKFQQLTVFPQKRTSNRYIEIGQKGRGRRRRRKRRRGRRRKGRGKFQEKAKKIL
jgi:hypothetical protein